MTVKVNAHRYQRIKNIFFFVSIVLDIAVLLCLFYTGASASIKAFALRFSGNPFLLNGIYVAVFGIIVFLVHLPIDFFLGYVWEKKFKLGTQKFSGWLVDECKKGVLSLLIILVLIEAIYLFLGKFPNRWWIAAGAFWLFLTFVMAKLTPNYIIPLFYKYGSIDDAHLKSRIKELFRRCNVKLEDIYSINFSEKTKKANAFLCGMGRNRRVVLSDTLLEKFSSDEIETVVAHELGHFKHKDILRLLTANIITTFIGLYLVHLFLMAGVDRYGLSGIDDITFLPVAALIFMVFGLCAMPVLNGYSRMIERRADLFTLRKTENASAFISMMEKLGEMNLAEKKPHRLIELLLYDHPPMEKRIQFARNFA